MAKKIIIEGMSCGHCVKHVTTALEELGLSKVTVDLDSKSALIEGEVSDQAIKAAIEDVGYDIVEIKEV
ncbi:MAG TPA: heavy metal transport/detoxification protein [Clostridium sp.]|jgi:copper chaperone CopZ|nr:heavy-metal-associated domain-containing protein [Clostridia bacterium]HCW03857.1 heavy metal transport/detoxification protein [Clostridium sp.]